MMTTFVPGRSARKYATHSPSSRASRDRRPVAHPLYEERSSTSASTQLVGSEAAMAAGYWTVSRPSPRPPTQRSVFGRLFVDGGVEGPCSKATSFLLYL